MNNTPIITDAAFAEKATQHLYGCMGNFILFRNSKGEIERGYGVDHSSAVLVLMALVRGSSVAQQNVREMASLGNPLVAVDSHIEQAVVDIDALEQLRGWVAKGLDLRIKAACGAIPNT